MWQQLQCLNYRSQMGCLVGFHMAEDASGVVRMQDVQGFDGQNQLFKLSSETGDSTWGWNRHLPIADAVMYFLTLDKHGVGKHRPFSLLYCFLEHPKQFQIHRQPFEGLRPIPDPSSFYSVVGFRSGGRQQLFIQVVQVSQLRQGEKPVRTDITNLGGPIIWFIIRQICMFISWAFLGPFCFESLLSTMNGHRPPPHVCLSQMFKVKVSLNLCLVRGCEEQDKADGGGGKVYEVTSELSCARSNKSKWQAAVTSKAAI